MIWGDDIGITNLSCYSDGLMGYRTPNIDRTPTRARGPPTPLRGAESHRGQSSFITGQSVYRTGLSKVGDAGRGRRPQAEDVTIAELLKPLGYATGQFGKNHLGDLNKYLPTVHGFDEFFGNLYHLNAEEEPEAANWPAPEDFRFNERFRPRGCCTRGPPPRTTRARTRATVASAGSASRTRGR
ncbi:MAG: sulfatase-like hydrolase/transferase [Solirubrobacteraceae bacterium]